MAFTFSKLASVAVGSGGASTISFSNIPQNYKDLCLKISARTTNAYFRDSVDIKFNGALTSAGTSKDILAQGTSVVSQSLSNLYVQIEGNSGTTANIFGNAEIYIPNYTSSNNKSLSIDAVTENNAAADNSLNLSPGLWSNSAAINAISLDGGGDFMQYSTATLYGIKNS
jgi:hypothetical protein